MGSVMVKGTAVARDIDRQTAVTRAEPEDAYLSLRALSVYAGLSVRTLRLYLRDRTRPLPHYRIRGKILVRRSEYDDWMTQFRATFTDLDMTTLVDDMVAGLR